MRDNQRSKVYQSEREVFTWGQTIPSDRLNDWTWDNIYRRAWYYKRWGNYQPKIELGTSRGVSYGGLIKLGVGARNEWVICHELAHELSYDKHGPDFARHMLFLIEKIFGKDKAAELKTAYKKNRVKVSPATRIAKPTMPGKPKQKHTDKYQRMAKRAERLQQTNLKHVETAAKKAGIFLDFERYSRGHWSLDMIAPEGMTFVDHGEFGEAGFSSPNIVGVTSYPESAFTSSEKFADCVRIIESGLQEPVK